MRDVNDGQTEHMQLFNLQLHMLEQLLIQRTQRLIHQYQLRFKYQHTRQGHALLLPTRHLRRITIGQRRQLNHIGNARHPIFNIHLVHAALAEPFIVFAN